MKRIADRTEERVAALAAAAAHQTHGERTDTFRVLAALMDRLGFPYALDSLSEEEDPEADDDDNHLPTEPKPRIECEGVITRVAVNFEHDELLITVGAGIPLRFRGAHLPGVLAGPKCKNCGRIHPEDKRWVAPEVGDCIRFEFRPLYLDVVNGAVVFRATSFRLKAVIS